MARLPFDASSARGSDPPSAPRAIGVGEVCRLIKGALETGLPATLRVEGEISGLSHRNHWYFTLKDEQAVLSCVAWASSAARFGFVPQEGESVIATGSVSHYAPQGRTQFYVTRLEPVGTGALALRFRALCEELRRLGYFDEAHKKPIPAMPRRIAVITSATSAALKDVIDTARRRWPGVALLVIDVRVQGEGAAEQVAEAIELTDRHAASLGVDVILVTRGGGSIEDLWAFNERVVAEAIHRCRMPIVAAVGHESDVTVAELVADLRAATPTQAVMRIVPDRRESLAQITQMRDRMTILLRRLLEVERRRLDGLGRNELLRRPAVILARHRERLHQFDRELRNAQRRGVQESRRSFDAIADRLERAHPRRMLRTRRSELRATAGALSGAMASPMALRRQRLEGLLRALRAVDPTAILQRGYSITTRPDGTIVHRASDAPAGAVILTQLADGRLRSVVEAESGSVSTIGSNPPQQPRKPKRSAGADSMDLFQRGE